MIGGNVEARIEIRNTTKNNIGERTSEWTPVQILNGFLDYSGGDSKRIAYNTKLEESTHIFISHYEILDSRITESNSRILINGKPYDVLKYDDPMGMNRHWEIFLRYVGE